ncbi:MAG: sigma-54 dependent transcriptional regulator [Victivallaceae bacterium]|nr:sigma-54 dependent transcriptional regulator [Victivallaceae bacterium]
MKRLILTGWGWEDYAAAAALALRKNPVAQLFGVSTRRLPEKLATATDYDEILLCGVNLAGDPAALMKSLQKLKAKGVSVTWASCLPLPDEVPSEISDYLNIFVASDSATGAVAELYHLEYNDLLPLVSGKPTAETRPYFQLLEAAMYAYRNYQDEAAYGNAIRHIAKCDPDFRWSESERQLVRHYLRYGNRELVGHSAATADLLGRINRIAPHEHARVLISGESGTGKETVALQIHNKSPRKNEPFIAFNCASVTPNLLESRFFGHQKGAFTGADETRQGLFKQADGGTLFLDEIGELPLEAQGILLRVLEEGRFTLLGGKEEIEVNVRLIAATNRDLAAMVRDGKFRKDLFYRLSVVQIHMPPLREHKSDIDQIADGYWLKQRRTHLAPEQIEALKNYDYPGNVRELFNLLERASVLEETDFAKLIAEHKQMTASLAPQVAPELPDDLESAIRLHVKRVYEKYRNNLSKTAAALNVARNTVRKYLE